MTVFGCYKPKVITDEKKENKEKTENIDEKKYDDKVIEYDPLIKSDEYHQGFEKRKYSSLFPYEPHISLKVPSIHINTSDGSNSFATTNYTTADKKNGLIPEHSVSFSLSNCEEKYKFSNTNAIIKQKGNTTLTMVPKKSFNIKFDEKVNLLGLNNGNKFKRWVLNAMGYDVASLRDKIALYLGKQMFNNIGLYTSDSAFAELYLNNEYWGLYLVQERQQVNKNRVNIDDVEKREPVGSYTGNDIGYFFEYDFHVPTQATIGDYTFTTDFHDDGQVVYYNKQKGVHARNPRTSNKGPCNYYWIKSTIYNQSQCDFLANYVDKVYDICYEAIYNKKYYRFDDNYQNIIEVNDPNVTSYDIINSVIDIDSFVNMYLFQEIVMDNDIGKTSKFMQVDFSKKGNKKISWTALWDHDFCFGNDAFANGFLYYLYVGNYVEINSTQSWLVNLINEKWFLNLVKKRWKELINYGVLYNTLHYIDEFSITNKKSFEKNYDKWGYFPKSNTRIALSQRNSATDYNSGKNYMFNYLATRLNVINTFFGDGTKLFTF